MYLQLQCCGRKPVRYTVCHALVQRGKKCIDFLWGFRAVTDFPFNLFQEGSSIFVNYSCVLMIYSCGKARNALGGVQKEREAVSCC